MPEEKGSVLQVLFEQLNAHANAKTVYGEPVEREGVTVIPVAKVQWGFGGGGGGKGLWEQSGGGGGARAIPIGYIEMKRDGAEFKPIHDLASLIPLAVGSCLGGIAAALLLKRLLR